MLLPQELEVWYIIPAIRRELCREMVKTGSSQKEIAAQLGVTESAVSQYVHDKRANKVKFSPAFKAFSKETARKIVRGEISAFAAVQQLSRSLYPTREVCGLHTKFDKTVKKDCTVCMDHSIIVPSDVRLESINLKVK